MFSGHYGHSDQFPTVTSETTLPEEPCPVPLRQVQLFQADGQTDTPVSQAGLAIL